MRLSRRRQSLQALGAALLRRATPADVAEAVVVMRRAVKLKPQFADALTGLGIALRESGETEESISVLREAVKLKPSMIERATTWGCRCSAIEATTRRSPNSRRRSNSTTRALPRISTSGWR